MFKYKVEQKSYQIGKYKIGGDPRKTPTALAGTIFYLGQHKIFKDERKGLINREYAEKLIKKQEELADKTGLIPLLDVVMSFEESIEPILDFVFNVTDIPILIDAPYWKVKEPLIKYIMGVGLDNRVIYNTITSSSYDEEFQLLSETEIETFVLLPIETQYWTTQARMKLINKMIEKALSYNFKKHNFLIDTCVIDFTSLGLAMNSIEEIKNIYGYPAGCSAHNLVDAWKNIEKNLDISRS